MMQPHTSPERGQLQCGKGAPNKDADACGPARLDVRLVRAVDETVCELHHVEYTHLNTLASVVAVAGGAQEANLAGPLGIEHGANGLTLIDDLLLVRAEMDLHEVDAVGPARPPAIPWSGAAKWPPHAQCTGNWRTHRSSSKERSIDRETASYEKSYAVVCSPYMLYSPHFEARKYWARRSAAAVPMRSSESR
jgi:hypothetical protein